MDDKSVFTAFVDKWVGTAKASQSVRQNLSQIERALQITLPLSYRGFVEEYGTPSTAWLLESIVAGGHELADVASFIDLPEVVATTRDYEAAGMEPGYVGIADDCMGNLFLFRTADCVGRPQDAAVWFFDHDFVTVDQVAPTFVSWLREYLDLEVVAGAG